MIFGAFGTKLRKTAKRDIATVGNTDHPGGVLFRTEH